MKWDELSTKERDDLVALQLFGYERKRCIPFGMVFAKDGKAEKPEHWSPSTDINAAWEVAEKFIGYSVDKFLSTQKFKVTVFTNEGLAYRALGKSAPEAICIAALQSVGVDIE